MYESAKNEFQHKKAPLPAAIGKGCPLLCQQPYFIRFILYILQENKARSVDDGN